MNPIESIIAKLKLKYPDLTLLEAKESNKGIVVLIKLNDTYITKNKLCCKEKVVKVDGRASYYLSFWNINNNLSDWQHIYMIHNTTEKYARDQHSNCCKMYL